MSRIQPLQIYAIPQNHQGKRKAVAFNGTPAEEKEKELANFFINQIKKQINGDEYKKFSLNHFSKYAGAKMKQFDFYLAKNKGEIQSQLINAAFTTTLAPLFIAFNPFSSQDSKTKKYTALRQPISAGIALTGGLSMTIGINSFLQTMGSEGYMPSIDLRMNPQDRYLKRKFKSEYKAAMKDEASKNAFMDKYYPNWKESKTEIKVKDLKEKYFKVVRDERFSLFTSLISEKPEDLSFNEEKKQILLKTTNDQGETIQKVIGQDIPNMTKTSQFNKYIEDNNLYSKKLSTLLKNDFKCNFFDDGKLKEFSIGKDMSSVKAMDFLRSIGLVKEGGLNEEELIKTLSAVREQRVVGRLIDATGTTEVEDVQTLITEIGKQTARHAQLMMGEHNSSIEKVTLKQMFDNLKISNAKNPEDVKIPLQEFLDKPVSEVIQYFNTLFKENNVKGFLKNVKNEETGKTEKVALNILDYGARIMANNKAKTKIHFDNNSFFIGILSNLVITAVTCTALNWVYPRLVALCFPNLVKDDGSKTPPAQQKQPQAVAKGGN